MSYLLLILATISCSRPKVLPQAIDLRVEYLLNPLGLDVPAPRLSWKMQKDVRGARQTAYRIRVATSDSLLLKNTPDLWNSGKIESGQSIQVAYQGKPLTSGMEASWDVQIWDEENQVSAWSDVAHWEMALMNPDDWKAEWIGAPEKLSTGKWKLPAPLIRKEINISKKIAKARVYISGLGYYELYINGQKVGDHVLSPNQTNYDRRKVEKWTEPNIGSMNTRVLYETFNITSLLKDGSNVLGAILGNGWYIQADWPDDTSLWYDTPRLIAQFELEYQDGSKELITTDKSWKASLSPIVYNGIHTGEIYDARLEQKSWNEAGFDDSKWLNAVAVRPPSGVLKSEVSPPDRITRMIRPISVTKTDTNTYRFDLGQMISGWARLKISGKKGTEIKLRFIEELGSTYSQTDTYILKGEGTENWEPRFTWHAFRYVDVIGSPVALTADNLEGCVVNTDIQESGTFECSNPLFNRILEIYRNTQLGNVHGGVPSDCPHRERRGYTGDGQISARAAIYNFDMSRFYTKWLGDISDAQNHKTGYVPNTAPYQDGGGGTAWGSAYVIVPWYMYEYYSDKQILEQHYSGMKHWVEFLKSQLNKDGILVNQGLGEWVPPALVDLPADFVNSCYYYYCYSLMAQISEALGNNSDKDYFTTLAVQAKTAINKTYFNAGTSEYSIDRQGANIFPLGFGIADTTNVESILGNLVKNIDKHQDHFDTGILATPLLLDVLTNLGRVDLAYTLMDQRDFPSFGYMIEKGATTIWETWQGDASHSHPMFGSVCAWLYRYLGGISSDPKAPGFKHSVIKPYPVRSLSYANTNYSTPYGDVQSNWKLENDDFILNVSVPANTTATVYVWNNPDGKITESGRSVRRNSHIRIVKKDGPFAVFDVESGNYQFESKGAVSNLKYPVLATPVIHLADTLTTIRDTVWVKITSDVSGAQIRYTTDNSDPSQNSTLYTQPFVVTQPSVVKAKTYLDNYPPSFIKSNFIDFVDPKQNGLTYRYLKVSGQSCLIFQNLKSRNRAWFISSGSTGFIRTRTNLPFNLTGNC
ncbi:MAG: family 78 glycoside hydrolase catalytic domain [Prolixibacteraceae bacterium]